MKKVLILVISTDEPPYDSMITNSIKTWDSVYVEGTETVFYCAVSNKTDTDKIIYLPVDGSLLSMGKKTLLAYEWALKNKEFDYIARVNASCFVHKQNLLDYVQDLPETNLFAGTVAQSQNGFDFCWGGAQYLISKDVIQKIVDNQRMWVHTYMEDESASLVVAALGIPFTQGYSGAIDKLESGWQCISYGGESITFHDFADLKRLKHFFVRIKQDGKRYMEEFIMEEMFRVLN